MAKEENFTRPSEFAKSVINTVREPLIVLNQDLRVVTVSRSFYEVFQVKPEETVGQLINNLGNKQWDIPKLRELLEDILPERQPADTTQTCRQVQGNRFAADRRATSSIRVEKSGLKCKSL